MNSLIKRLPQRWPLMLACIAVFFAVSIPIARRTTVFIHHLLVWNLFLAVLALVFSVLMHVSKSRALAVLWGVGWLLFFPNAPYLVTDLMHITYLEFYGHDSGRMVHYIWPWFTLLHLAIGVLFGTMMGLCSLSLVHQRLARWLGGVWAWLTVAAVSVLSGYAIFLGRYVRVNSWDVLSPGTLIAQMAQSANRFSLALTGMYAIYIFAAYVVYYAFCSPRRTDV